MARGYAQSRSEKSGYDQMLEAYAPKQRYVKSSYIEPNQDFKKNQKTLEEEGGLNDRAKSLVEKFGSGRVTNDKDANYRDNEPGSIRGRFTTQISPYGTPPGFREDKAAWTFEKTDILSPKGEESEPSRQTYFAWREYNGKVYWSWNVREEEGPKSYNSVRGGFDKSELVENGGRFKDIKEAIEWSMISDTIAQLDYNRGFQRYIESGGSLD